MNQSHAPAALSTMVSSQSDNGSQSGAPNAFLELSSKARDGPRLRSPSSSDLSSWPALPAGIPKSLR